ncbi:MAG: alpha/beta fold hydrolase, partial [Desulfobacterales bacterium]|nr:alpha/beta fold hydrolase [Desulfobacterales bacterium]
RRGDQVVHLNVVIPTRLTEEQRQLFQELGKSLGRDVTPQEEKGFFEKEFNPIIIELPGHGESGGEGEEEIVTYAEQIYAFLQAVGVRKIFLVGHSMGGAIVQTLALTHPEVIKGIVLVGTGARLKVLPMILNGIKNNFRETIPRIVQFAYSRKAPPELIEGGVNQMLQCRPEVLYGDFAACDRFDGMKELEKIHLPTLVLCGEDDELTPPNSSMAGSKARNWKSFPMPAIW